MRVISGTARGIRLNTIPEYTTRPTVDRVKENLFNIIQHEIYDRTVLDLFSGSGGLCIECLSRGARKAYLVEKNPRCIPYIKDNLERTRLTDRAVVLNEDFEYFLSKARYEDLKFDIIFLDPPHKKGLGFRAMDLIAEYDLLSEEGIIVVEHHPDEDYPERQAGFSLYKAKRYGNTTLSFYSKEETNENGDLPR